MIRNHGKPLLLAGLLLAGMTAGCGGNNSEGPGGSALNSVPAETGIFVDSPVEGLRYEGASFSGRTRNDGSFDYAGGEIICFFVGQVEIGCSEARELMTPIDLFDNATPTSTPVLNVVRLLLSLDADADGSNGIDLSRIPLDAQLGGPGVDMADFDIMNDSDVLDFIEDFGNDLIIDEDDALNHFVQSLADFNVLATDLVGDWNLAFFSEDDTEGLIQNIEISITNDDLDAIEALVDPRSFASFVLETEMGLCFFEGGIRDDTQFGLGAPGIPIGPLGPVIGEPFDPEVLSLISIEESGIIPGRGTVRVIEGQVGCFPSGLDPRNEEGEFGIFEESEIASSYFRMDLIDPSAIYSEEDLFGSWEVASDQGSHFDSFEFSPFFEEEISPESFSEFALTSLDGPFPSSGFAFEVNVETNGSASFSTTRVSFIDDGNEEEEDDQFLLVPPFPEDDLQAALLIQEEFPEEGSSPYLVERCDYQGQFLPTRDTIRGTYSCEASGDGIFDATMRYNFLDESPFGREAR